jgi:hypothetical protein
MPPESKYTPEMIALITKCCECFDCTNAQIAKFVGLDVSTLTDWSNKYPEFKEMIENSRYRRDGEVVASFYKKACGYYTTKKKVLSNGEVISYEDYVPPDTLAGIFYLKNRLPEDWKDRQETYHSGNINVTPVISIGGINEQLEIPKQETATTPKTIEHKPSAPPPKTTSSV